MYCVGKKRRLTNVIANIMYCVAGKGEENKKTLTIIIDDDYVLCWKTGKGGERKKN